MVTVARGCEASEPKKRKEVLARGAKITAPVLEFGPFRDGAMTRYIQKISLRPYSETEIWTGWELEGSEGPVEGLVLAEAMSEEDLARLGVTDFQKIPREYLETGAFLPRKA